MEETVEAFSKVRTTALNLARNQGSRSQSPKRKAAEASSDAYAPHEPKRLRTSARLNRSRGEHAVATPPVQEIEEQVVPDSNNDDDDEEYVPDACEYGYDVQFSILQLTMYFCSKWSCALSFMQQKDERMAGIWTFRILSWSFDSGK
jgi:hypothetical protein